MVTTTDKKKLVDIIFHFKNSFKKLTQLGPFCYHLLSPIFHIVSKADGPRNVKVVKLAWLPCGMVSVCGPTLTK